MSQFCRNDMSHNMSHDLSVICRRACRKKEKGNPTVDIKCDILFFRVDRSCDRLWTYHATESCDKIMRHLKHKNLNDYIYIYIYIYIFIYYSLYTCSFFRFSSLLTKNDTHDNIAYNKKMASLRKITQANQIANQQLSKRAPTGFSQSPDVTELKIELLDLETGRAQETLQLRGTHIPFAPFQFAVSQQVEKFYYPGGPVDRRPTIQVLGAMDEDFTLRGRLKGSKLPSQASQDEPLQILKIMQRFVKTGQPCRLQIGFFIKYVTLRNLKAEYKLDSDIQYSLDVVVIGDYNPITGEQEEQQEKITAKIFETESDQDSIDETRAIIEEIRSLKNEATLFGFLDPVLDTIQDVERTLNDAVDVVEEFAEEVEKTAQKIERTLLIVERLRSRLFRIQGRLHASVNKVKRAGNPQRLLNSFNVFALVERLINRSQLNLKKTEDNVKTQLISTINKTYVWKMGDTWPHISVMFYNTPDRAEELRLLNNSIERPGTVVLIPK